MDPKAQQTSQNQPSKHAQTQTTNSPIVYEWLEIKSPGIYAPGLNSRSTELSAYFHRSLYKITRQRENGGDFDITRKDGDTLGSYTIGVSAAIALSWAKERTPEKNPEFPLPPDGVPVHAGQLNTAIYPLADK